MAILGTLTSGAKSNLPHIADRSGLVKGYLVDKVERYGASVAYGFVQNYYREKAMVKGVPLDILVGGGLTLLGAGLEIFSRGRSALAPHLNAIGDAGVQAYFLKLGAVWGTKASGRKAYILEKGATAPALPGLTQVGLEPAVGGAVLDEASIARYCESR